MDVTAQTQPRRRSILLIAALVAYALYQLARGVPQIAYYWLPQGDFGLTDFDIKSGVIRVIEPRSVAADAGLRVGDRIDMTRMSLHQIVVSSGNAGVGEVWHVHVLSPGKPKVVTLVARPIHFSAAQIRDDLLGQIEGLVRLILGVSLVLLKPSRLTWLFLLSWTGGGSFTDWVVTFPVWAGILAELPYTILIGAVPFLYAMFGLVFPNDELRGWRRRVFPFVVGAGVVGSLFAVAGLLALPARVDLTATDWITNVADITGGAIATAALVTYYFESRGRWFVPIFAFTVGVLFETWWNLHTIYTGGFAPPTQAFLDFFELWSIVVTIVFAYAIIRHGMLDVEFILSRGLVISTLALAGVALFIGIDIGFTELFHGSRAELAVDIAVALAIGFGARGVYGRLSDLVDRMLFKRRYEARIRLKEALNAVAAAGSTRAIEEIVTADAASALSLASAVFFRRVADGGFLREIGFGWPTDAIWHLLADDVLVAALQNINHHAIDLQAVGWSRVAVSPPQAPVFAIPMHSGGRTLGVTFYGSRLDGVMPSPDEVGGLSELARRGASAYSTLDSMRATIAPRELAGRSL